MKWHLVRASQMRTFDHPEIAYSFMSNHVFFVQNDLASSRMIFTPESHLLRAQQSLGHRAKLICNDFVAGTLFLFLDFFAVLANLVGFGATIPTMLSRSDTIITDLTLQLFDQDLIEILLRTFCFRCHCCGVFFNGSSHSQFGLLFTQSKREIQTLKNLVNSQRNSIYSLFLGLQK